MIHEITLKNTPKHSGKTFVFNSGLNLIRGENESGKSSILEYLDFLLHGSVALRLPVSLYSSAMSVDGSFTINGVRYRIIRTTKKAQLFNAETEQLIASGTKPVDLEVRKLLGYSRSVFMVSNYSSQDSINYLSTLKPAERKRTIDNVVGLTAVETVLTEHKTELSVLNKALSSVKNREVEQPPKPTGFRINNVDDLIDSCRKQITEITVTKSIQSKLKEQHEALERNKPEMVELGDISGLIPDMDETRIAQIQEHKKSLMRNQDNLVMQKNNLVKPVSVSEPDHSHYLEGVTNELIRENHNKRGQIVTDINFFAERVDEYTKRTEGETFYSEEEIAEAEKQTKLRQDWVQLQELKERGSVNCNHCGEEVLLAADIIKEHYAHVPENVDAPVIPHDQMNWHNNQLNENLTKLEKYKADLTKKQDALADFDACWYSETAIVRHIEYTVAKQKYDKYQQELEKYETESVRLTNAQAENVKELKTVEDEYPDDKFEAHRLAVRNQTIWGQNQRDITNWQKNKDALEPYVGDQRLEFLTAELPRLEADLVNHQRNKQEWVDYDAAIEKYELWVAEYENAQCDVDLEKTRIEALNVYKAQIKTAILPSVNAVATQWLHRMSEGKHHKVELTEDMAILVNDEPIEALSISGRALGHLSLRMALGQVLTNHVFPVFMADEVDASMRNERAQNVLDALTDMLKGSMKQIIMISHRELEHVDNIIDI